MGSCASRPSQGFSTQLCQVAPTLHWSLTNRVRGPYRKLRPAFFPSIYGPSASHIMMLGGERNFGSLKLSVLFIKVHNTVTVARLPLTARSGRSPPHYITVFTRISAALDLSPPSKKRRIRTKKVNFKQMKTIAVCTQLPKKS